MSKCCLRVRQHWAFRHVLCPFLFVSVWFSLSLCGPSLKLRRDYSIGVSELRVVDFFQTILVRCSPFHVPTSQLLNDRAIRRGNLAEVKRFLDEGGDIEAVGGRFHSTLLTEACRFRAAKVVELLLDRGAAAYVSGGGLWTPLHYLCCSGSSTAGAAAAAALVTKLVENHADVDAADFQSRSPLHLAAARGSAAVVLALLEAGTYDDTTVLRGKR